VTGPDVRALLVSAGRAEGLQQLRESLAVHLERHPELDLADVEFTLRHGRRQLGHRFCVSAANVADAVQELRSQRAGTDRSSVDARHGIAFLLPGQGAQQPGMYRYLYRQQPAFAAAVTSCALHFAPHLGTDVRDVMFNAGRADQLRQTAYTQPAVFTAGYALAELLRAQGIEPVALLGHSIGELTAATLAEVLDLPTACRVIANRGRLMQDMRPGLMASVSLDETQLRPRLGKGVEICALNAPRMTVVGGPEATMRPWLATLHDDGIESQVLNVSHAFHTSSMQEAAERFAELLATADLQAPSRPVLSNVSGTWLADSEATDPAYWARQLRSPVRFAECLATLARGDSPAVGLLVDAGSSGFAAHMARLVPEVTQPVVDLAIGGDPVAQAIATHAALGRLWEHGAPVEPAGAGPSRRRLRLPTYPFHRDRHWLEGRHEPAQSGLEAAATDQARPAPRLPAARWLWAQAWTDVAPPSASRIDDRPWIVFANPDSVGRELVALTRAHISDVRVAWSGKELVLAAECVGDPAVAEHHEKVLNALRPADGRARLVYAWSLGGHRHDLLGGSFYDVVRHAQACSSVFGSGPPVPVHFLTTRAVATARSDEVIAERSTILGVSRVLPFEVASIQAQVVDIGPASSPELILAAFGLAENTVAIRGSRLLAPRFEAVPAPSGPGPIRHGATYLITGGLGGVGTAIARWLGREYDARVVLAGRRPGSVHAARLAELAGAGIAATYVDADVTKPEDLRHLISATAALGPIRGVFHCAGRAGAGLMSTMELTEAEKVLAPKVAGSRALAEVMAGESLDFVVLCSSHNSLLGRFGQADYCAANAFLDGKAHERSEHRTRWLSVNLDVWSGAGMAVDTSLPESLREWRQSTFEHALRPDEAGRVFGSALACGLAQVIVSTRSFADVARSHEADEKDRLQRALIKVRGSKPTRAVVRSDAAGSLSGDTAGRIATIWRELLGVESIGPHESFLDLGGHSLVATMMLSRLRAELGVRLPLRDFLSEPTIAALARSVAGSGTKNDSDSSADPFTRLVALPRASQPTTTSADAGVRQAPPSAADSTRREPDGGIPLLSLMFFSAAADVDPGQNPYHELLTAAQFADRQGLHAIWLPERHFNAFGGLYPSPAVLAAVLARETRNVRLRAGSVISPLHSPPRIAEEWAVVDCLSGGRVDLSFGSGWHVNDFVLAPHGYDERKARMFNDIEIVSRLWRGEAVTMVNGAGVDVAIRTLPRPVQATLPVWITGESAGTFAAAGACGANILTATMHQDRSQLAEHIGIYREARQKAGRDPSTGVVTLMQHTFIDPAFDQNYERIRDCYASYVRTNIGLQAAGVNGFGAAGAAVSANDIRALADRNLARLADGGGLLGTPLDCAREVSRLAEVGVNEIAALIDFLPESDLVLRALPNLETMRSIVLEQRRGRVEDPLV
jgi:phthiocerol/phenolphthiocerol synthesis type-I polyketide synthase E